MHPACVMETLAQFQREEFWLSWPATLFQTWIAVFFIKVKNGTYLFQTLVTEGKILMLFQTQIFV